MRGTSLMILMAALLAACGTAFAETWQIDAVHSTVMFRIKHMDVGYFYGVFKDISGTVVFDPSMPEQSSVNAVVKTASIDSRNPDRDKHLMGPDFFDVEKYPEMQFKSVSWKKLSEDGYEVTGDFTLLGVTKRMTILVRHTGAGKGIQGEMRTGFETVFTIKRGDFGMTKFLPTGASDEVTLTISIEAAATPPAPAK